MQLPFLNLFSVPRLRPLRPVLVMMFAVLAGCELVGQGTETTGAYCPTVSILEEGVKITRFRPGPGRDLTDVVFDGSIHKVTAACNLDKSKKDKDGNLEVELEVQFILNRGPASHDGKAVFSYFVTVIDDQNRVMAKQDFPISRLFKGNQFRVLAKDEPIYLNIPVVAGQNAKDFRILAGFQLSRSELEYNRAHP